MYLREGWSGATAAEISVLVHEMVHHLQHEARLGYACPAASDGSPTRRRRNGWRKRA